MLSRDSLGKIPTLVSISSTRLLHHTCVQGLTHFKANPELIKQIVAKPWMNSNPKLSNDISLLLMQQAGTFIATFTCRKAKEPF
jgi:hypothetical protein